MIVEKDGVRYMHSRTRRIVKGFVYEGEDVWRLEGKKRIYVRSQRKGKLIAIEGHEEEFESYVSQKKLPPDEICQLVPTDPKYHPLKNKIKGKAPPLRAGRRPPWPTRFRTSERPISCNTRFGPCSW